MATWQEGFISTTGSLDPQEFLFQVAFCFDTLLNVVMPLIIIITMNFGMALKIWLYTRRNSKTQRPMKLQQSSVKIREIVCESFVTKSRLNVMPDEVSKCGHFEGPRGSSKRHSLRCQHSNRCLKCPEVSARKCCSSPKGNEFQNKSKVTTRNERKVTIKIVPCECFYVFTYHLCIFT